MPNVNKHPLSLSSKNTWGQYKGHNQKGVSADHILLVFNPTNFGKLFLSK